MAFGVNKKTGRPGPEPKPPRDGDKIQARATVNQEVKLGRLPNPNSIACVDCGHFGDGRRHEYDHHLGYDAAHHKHVQAVCSKCHGKRGEKAKQTHCKRGHSFTKTNTFIKANGCRQCIECRRLYDRTKRTRPPGYWKEIYARRKSKRKK